MSVTIKDIAAAAGVSHSTVSKALRVDTVCEFFTRNGTRVQKDTAKAG